MNHYTFRLSMLKNPCTLELHDTVLHVLDQTGSLTRTIDLSQVRTIQVYDGVNTSDPETGPYRSEFCKLTFKSGKALYFRNGMYISPSGKMGEIATNQSDTYQAFLAQLKKQVAINSPRAVEVSGWLLASLAWWCNFLLGLGLIVMGVCVFWTDPFWTALGVALFCFPFGIMLLWLGALFGIGYWPKSRPVQTQFETLIVE